VSLAEALRRVADQAGLQFIYEQALVNDRRAIPPPATDSPDARLERLLRGTGLRWRYIDEHTVAIFRPTEQPETVRDSAPGRVAAKRDEGRPPLLDIDVTATLPRFTGLTSSALGFERPLVETPRSVFVVNEDAIDLFSLSAVEDLLRVAPGVFTTTRFGVQGSVDIRAVPADSYFRGMKRLTLQGHGRSVLAALDSIEVIGGPPSPIYGLGKFGGFTNVVPKSGRARDGRYLQSAEGFVQGLYGSYDRREVSFGWGGPVSAALSGDRAGGFYVYGLVEDSGTFTDGVPVKQRMLQAATSVDEVFGRFRLETGINLQESVTAGALIGRLTQDLVDTGEYIGGSPLVNLDLNGNGRIGFLEMSTASPVLGRLTVNNQPLSQVFAWPADAAGKPLPLSQFPRLSGIPQTMYDYLQAHPEADPGGVLRARGVGGPLPVAGAVPVGMVLDPRTIRSGTIDLHRSPAYERKLDGRFATFYFDLIDDADPTRTLRNQLFIDAMDQYKSSNQPFSQVQRVFVIENKFTATRRLEPLPWGFEADTLLTANVRNTISSGRQTFADYGNHRGDALDPNWNASIGGMTPNGTFSSSVEYPLLTDDGLPWGSIYRTHYSEAGLGGLFELTMPGPRTVLSLGARYDVSEARNSNEPERFNYNTGTALNPGQVLYDVDAAHGWDGGPSWSASLSQPLPGGWRPYVTYARSSILLDGNNNSLANAVINAGHVGSAELKEIGLKARLRDGAVEFAAAAFEQGRLEVESDDDVNVVNAYATSTTTRGWQAELRWALTQRSLISLYALRRHTRYTPNVGGLVQVDARALGFVDVLDANGRVIYPAEAFLYGGRTRVMLPNGLEQYAEKQGNPPTQIGLSAVSYVSRNWGYSLRGNYLSSTCSGRLCLVELPSSLVFDAGVFARIGRAELKLDALNLTNARYFRARTGDVLGDVIGQSMPDRRWQFALRYSF
jgi:outer membrane receptor protein involved in Fe transport